MASTTTVQTTQTQAPVLRAPPNAQDLAPSSHDVRATLYYYKDREDGKLTPAVIGKPETFKPSVEPHEVTITDISRDLDKFTLTSHGFQIVNHKSNLTYEDFHDTDRIKTEYYAETSKLLKQVTGASHTLIFDHFIRNPTSPLGPVRHVHIDQTPTSARNRVIYHLPSESPHLLRGRYEVINVWRPLKPIYRDPLAVADSHSVAEEDLLAVPLFYPDRPRYEVGETYSVRYGVGRHKWYYCYGQGVEQVMMFKCFESKRDGRARRCPHSSFECEGTAEMEVRESIEIRALVFHIDEETE
ncbi:hypothetical protein FQN50_002592 [Emmonsiellopsis sp. PD_5]|nr:hypothetical protein FQN50_002592 [Emmonsiellopsis sp. PD_5]